jgi:glycosyltransferase involved in cell wall biosynthesis
MPKVSVIIPCYNQGQFVDEAIESVFAQSYRDFEVIVVNDGSTDPQTNLILESYNRRPVKIIHTANQGLACARNNGISEATGEYILPLDADDKLGSSYMEKAVSALDANSDFGIVYCEAEFFGEKIGKWRLPEYKFPDILLSNVIVCSGFYRKSDWQKVNGYNPNMIYGFEDHDFWLSLIELGKRVYRIPETLFYYRKRPGSMKESLSPERLVHSYEQLFKNHTKLYTENIGVVFQYILRLHSQINSLSEKMYQP